MAKDKSTAQSSRPEDDDDDDKGGKDDDDTSTGAGQNDDAGGDDDKGGQDDQDDADKGKGERTFTQAEVDAMIERRLRRERRKGKQGNSTKADDADDDKGGKGGDAQGAKSDDGTEARVVARLRTAEARQVARDLKVRPDRIKSVIRLAELDGIDPDDTDDIEDAIAEVLEDHPEWKAQPSKDVRPKVRASGRDDSGDTKQGRTWTRAEIAALSDDDYEKNRDSINEAMKKGLIKS